jgi:flavin-dependent dehydrogenase
MSLPTETVEHVIVGAGPAGLRAAQVLAESGREVIVLEKNREVGPKTCAGGLSRKAVIELDRLGLPRDAGRDLLAHASFHGETPAPLDSEVAAVRTISRRRLGEAQSGWALSAGAEIRTGAAGTRFDFRSRTLEAGGRRLRYRHLIGADGSASMVRRALALPSPRSYFAAEFNVPGVSAERLWVEYDSRRLGNGYFWVFPHRDYTSFGAGGHKHLIPPATIRPYLEERLAQMGVAIGGTPYEGAAIEVEFAGFDFPDGVHLVGDAAGMPSALTAEGIYAALITGEEVARRILDPGYPAPKTRAWLRIKRWHDALGRMWLRPTPRNLSLSALRPLSRVPIVRRWISTFFLEG